jgi:hypothetical protein
MLVESTAVIEWPAGPGSGAPGRIEVANGTLVSPPVRDLDVYALLQKVREAGVTIVKWDDEHAADLVEVTVRFTFREPEATEPGSLPPDCREPGSSVRAPWDPLKR